MFHVKHSPPGRTVNSVQALVVGGLDAETALFGLELQFFKSGLTTTNPGAGCLFCGDHNV